MLQGRSESKGNGVSQLPDLEQIEIKNAEALWAWLDAHHAQEASVLLVTWKATKREWYVSREAVLDALIAYGWIDGRRYVVDTARTAQLIAPRATQVWAQSYKDRAEALEADGRMQPAGRMAVVAGRASGLWDFMADVDRLEVPDDLDSALGDARRAWDDLAPSYRRNVLRWIKLAKTAPTRDKRIAQAAKTTREGVKIPQM